MPFRISARRRGAEGDSAVERDGTSAGQDGGRGMSPELLEALAGLAPGAVQAIAEVIVLHREFPAWAVWIPERGRPWTGVRPASARAPGPELPLVWVRAGTAGELAAGMRRADSALSPD
jgi:hypothetical protein